MVLLLARLVLNVLGLGLFKSLLMVLLLARLVLNVLGLLSLVDRGIAHELIILLLGLSFCGTGLRLETSKVRLDDFNHAHNAAILGTHALVWLIEDIWLLYKGCGLCSLGIEFLEHAESLGHCSLGILGILDRDSVLCLLFLADAGGLGDCSIKLSNGFRKICDFLGELCNRCFQFINLGMERLDSFGLLFASLLVGGQLSITPALVLSLFIGLLHELHDQILDHLLHLLERIISNPHGQDRQHTAVDS